MLFCVMALEFEAREIIEKYKLKRRNTDTRLRLYENEEIKLIISSVSNINAAIATSFLLREASDEDFILNLGYAGVFDKNNLNKIFIINKILDDKDLEYFTDMLYSHNFYESDIISVDKVINKENYHLYNKANLCDMESLGFYKAANTFLKRDKIFILKVSSDLVFNTDTEKQKIKNFIEENKKKLDENILKAFDFIFDLTKNLKIKKDKIFTDEEKIILENIYKNLKLSKTMELDLEKYLKYYKLKTKNINFVEEYLKVEVESKKDGKKYFEIIKKKCFE